jgi:predicted transcriptional regulator
MDRIDRCRSYDDHNAIIILKDIADKSTYKIITSIMNQAKTVSEICHENGFPLSSVYKRIHKLRSSGIICIERISIDGKGKKVIYYKSRIKSLEFNLNQEGLLLRFSN